MFGIDDALLGSAVQAGGSLLGGIMGSDAAGDAAKQQAEAAQSALQLQREMYMQGQRDTAPYRYAGTEANKRLMTLLGVGGYAGGTGGVRADGISPVMQKYMKLYGVSDFRDVPPEARNMAYEEETNANGIDSASPEYGSLLKKFTANDLNADPVYQSGLQFGLDQGTKGINERAIANGGYDSGATLKALTRFGNDYGSTKANESYQRFTNDQNNVFGKLSGQQQLGANAATNSANAGAAFGMNAGNTMTDIGNANAAGTVGKANAMAGAFGGIGSAIQGYQNNQVLNKLLANRGGGGTPGGYTMNDVNSMFGY